jgi:hypothetical protein
VISAAAIRTDPPALRLVAARGGKACAICGIVSSDPLRKAGRYKGACGTCFIPWPARPLGEQLRLVGSGPTRIVFGFPAVMCLLLLVGLHRERRPRWGVAARRGLFFRSARQRPRRDIARWKTVVPPPRIAEIGGRKVIVTWRARHLRCYSARELTFPWRVIPLRKGYSLGTNALTAKDRQESKRLHLDQIPELALPKTRGDCLSAPRPCLHFICRHNLFLDVNPESGSIKYNFPGMEPDELEDLCSLDVADRYADVRGTTLEHVGLLMGLTLERARQIQDDALADSKLKLGDDTAVDDLDDDPSAFDLDDDTAGGPTCPECRRANPLGIIDVKAPDEALLQDPAWWRRCVIAGANRPKPTWWFCPQTRWYTVRDPRDPTKVTKRVKIARLSEVRGLPS